jgi:hypothetical protein
MLQAIRKSSRFLEDYNKYQEAISKIPDGAFKEEAKTLLNRLSAEVKKLDEMHNEMVFSKQLPTIGHEMREQIVTLRKQLEIKLKDFQETKKST